MFNDKYGLTNAVLNGKKTMTRRIIKAPRRTIEGKEVCGFAIYKTSDGVPYEVWLTGPDEESLCQLLPTYKVGEVVAVAQAYKNIAENAYFSSRGMKYEKGWYNKMYVAAYHMPHHIHITDIKVERLQDISEEDCLREGIEEDNPCYWVATDYNNPDFQKISDELADHLPDRNGKMVSYFWDSPHKCFAHLIDKVSGKGTWDSNPWVFAYTFELID